MASSSLGRQELEPCYRLYSHNDVRALQFVRRARSLGFSLPEIKDLLALWQARHRRSADGRRIALEHVRELDARVAELQSMRRTLQQLAATCHGDERPECPILDDLASPDGRRHVAASGSELGTSSAVAPRSSRRRQSL
jgi:DNA-binding transcriptional MerR regulator